MTLQEYAECINVNITITYYWDRKVWQASFENTNIHEGQFLKGSFGIGNTPTKAMIDYANEIKNKKISVGPYSNKIQYTVPNITEL